MANVQVTVHVVDGQPAPQPVEGILVRVFDASDVFLTELFTDPNGDASVLLNGSSSPGTKYIVRLVPIIGYTIQNGPTQEIYVLDPVAPPNTNIFDFVAESLPSVETSPDPDMCRLSGYFVDPSKRPLKNLVLIFHPREGYPKSFPLGGFPYRGQPSVVGGKIVASERRVNTDKDGYVSFDLPRKGVFDVYVQGLSSPDINLLAEVCIPDIGGIELSKVLFPYVESVVFDETSVSVPIGDSVEVGVTVYTSNLAETSKALVEALLDFSLDSESALLSVNEDGGITVTGLSAGVATLSVSRKYGTLPPYSPELADIQVLPALPVFTVS